MTVRERVARLEGLLERITRNASRPRPARAAAPGAAPASADAPVPPKPSAPDSAPVVVAVPAVQPAAIGPASDVPPPSSVPSAPPDAPTVPPFAAAPKPVTAPFEPSPAVSSPPEGARGVSSVPPWKPEPSSTVQARPSSMPPEELSDDDLVEVTTLPPAPAAAAPPDDFAEEMEEPPASSSRSKVAESLDQAMSSAAVQADEIEVPIHTPPPESGPQEAVLPAGIDAPRAPEFAGDDIVRPVSLGPTPEQLGETIELEGSDGPEIEIEVAGEAPPVREPERPVEELEVALPRAEMPSGTYDVAPSMPAETASTASAAPTLPVHEGPDVTLRPAVEGADVARMIRASEKAPETFGELLDLSLGL
ncbi:MAG TPA: hypothetical protein VFZ53_15080 [Polyangiaceae bacterium]